MSLLNLPFEVTLQLLQKMSAYDRINVCMTHPRLLTICSDRLLVRNSTKTISLNELRQLYQQSRTEEERDQCFNPKILDRLRTNNFNELVHMYMDPGNDQFFANHKILHSFKGNIVLESENEQFSEDFYQQFLSLIERIEGNLFLTFVDVKEYRNDYAERCAQTLSKKLKRGEKVFLMDFNEKLIHFLIGNHADDVKHYLAVNHYILRSKQLSCYKYDRDCQDRRRGIIHIPKTNGSRNTETMISMINGDRFLAPKQCLVNALPLVKAAELRGGWRNNMCGNCWSQEGSVGSDRLRLQIEEPAWSNCAGCELK